jgi:hypothetical protein
VVTAPDVVVHAPFVTVPVLPAAAVPQYCHMGTITPSGMVTVLCRAVRLTVVSAIANVVPSNAEAVKTVCSNNFIGFVLMVIPLRLDRFTASRQ